VGLRRKIAENMQEAKRRIPHFTLVEEFDVTDLEDTRAMMNRDRGDNPKLTVLPFLIAAMAKALPEWPMLNATFDDDAGVITRHGALNLAWLPRPPNGLMVAVIRDAQNKSVWQLAREILRLADAARTGKATREELSGSSITLSSLGPMGGVTSTPVINRPEVAIIAVNKVREMPVIVDGELEARKLMNLSLSCDHRVVDGWDAASFMQTLKGYIEKPDQAAQRIGNESPGSAQGRAGAGRNRAGGRDVRAGTNDRGSAGGRAGLARAQFWLGCQPFDLGQALGETSVALFRTHCGAFCPNEFRLYPEEVEHRLQIGFDMLEAIAGFIESATRHCDDDALVAGQAFGSIGAILEGLSSHGDPVDPGLSCDGTLKLYMGAPITTASADRNSSSTSASWPRSVR
jgi:hypothetical protein